MKLLLDTHIFLWLQTDPERLGSDLELVRDDANDLLLSAATSWELAIKSATGKLTLSDSIDRYVPRYAGRIGAALVPIEHQHLFEVASLPPLHRDPFDRLLVAQARVLGATLLTADVALAHYPASVRVVAA